MGGMHYDSSEEMKRRVRRIENVKDYRETTVFDYNYKYTPEETQAMMWDRAPDLKEVTLPREVFERLDLSPTSKLLYALLNQFPNGMRFRMYELSGLSGMGPSTIALALQLLEDRHLIIREKYGIGGGYVPPKYTPIKVPSRLENPGPPKFLSNDISNIEAELKERFYGLEFEQETTGFQKSHYR